MTVRLGLWICAGVLLAGGAACLFAAWFARRALLRSEKTKRKKQQATTMRTYVASSVVLGVCALVCVLCNVFAIFGVFTQKDKDHISNADPNATASDETVETEAEPEEGTLCYACSEKDLDMVQTLLAAGEDVTVWVNGKTPLMYACRYREGADNTLAAQIAALLLDAGAVVDETDADGRTALMYAAVSDEMTDAVQLLLDRGADINRLAGDSTALTYAVSGGAIENVTLLLDRGADVEGVRNPMREAVYPTMSFARRDILTALLQAGADTQIQVTLTNPDTGETASYSLRDCIEMDREDYLTAGRPTYDFGWEGTDWAENYRLILEMPAFS